MSIIAGARNMESARKFYDWALSAEAQALGAKAQSYQVPSNRNAPTPPQAPRLSDVKLINYDFQKFGSSDERKRLLTRFDAEIKISN
jgi:iron(III) transport system substrate-binding protein